jgi:hypothetical protein
MKFERFFSQLGDLIFSKTPKFIFGDISKIIMSFFAIFINIFKNIGAFIMSFITMIQDFFAIIQEFFQIIGDLFH